ncbi:MAG: DinB family protein [Ramlibacter sp.]
MMAMPALPGAVTLDALAAFPQQLEAHYAAIPQGFGHWAPSSWEGVPSEAFTAIEQVCHVRDIEIEGYHVRLRRTLAEVRPVLASLDSEALAAQRGYGRQDAATALSAFRCARAETLELLHGLAPEQLERTAVFEGYGPLTLRSLVHYLCSHDQQHLAGLQWLLGKIDAARA